MPSSETKPSSAWTRWSRGSSADRDRGYLPMISAASASSRARASPLTGINDPPALSASLAGASLASGGGPQRRDTATSPWAPYAAFGPAPAACRLRQPASPVDSSQDRVQTGHGRDDVGDHAALCHRRERLQVGERRIPEVRPVGPRSAVADRMAA